MAQREPNLLFGMLAVQLRLVTSQQLVVAGAAWTVDPERDLGDILVQQGVLAARDRDLIQQLVSRQVSAAGGDVSQVYEMFGGDEAALTSFGGSLVFDQPGSTPAYASIGVLPSASGPASISAGSEDPDRLATEQPGRYTLRGEQGRGGIGRVLIAFDESIRREIALKELLPGTISAGHGSDPSPQRRTSAQMMRFLREARITGQLEHPGIVPVYELGRRADDTLYYTMKLVRGATLSTGLKACHSIGDRLQLLPHFLDLCQAIAYAHSKGVVHRDIKPANVMVGEFGETVLLDWGLAKVRGQADDGAEKLADEVRLLKEAGAGESVVGKPIGTPSYMPPEQADGRIPDVDERSDVWSLGAVLYELLTGGPPFSGVTAFEVIGMVLTDEVKPVLERCKDAPPELAAIAMRCLQRDPAQRYQSVEELATDVKAFQTGGLVGAYRYSTGLMLSRWARRHWPVLATAMVGFFALILTGAIAYAHVVHQNRALHTANGLLDRGKNELLAFKLATESNQFNAQARSELASLLALEAGKYYQRVNTWMPEVDQALRACAGTQTFCHELSGHTGQIRRVAFSPDGRQLASCGDDSRIILWDMSGSAGPPTLLRGHQGGVACVAWSRDGKLLASAGHDGMVKLWDTVTGKALQSLTGHDGAVWAVAFSPDGQTIASGGIDKTVRLWSVANPALPPTVLRDAGGSIQAVAFSPDGKQLAAAGNDGLVRVYNSAALSSPPQVLAGHAGEVMWIAFSPDGQKLVSTGRDSKVLVWSTLDFTHAPVPIPGHEDTVTGASFSPDGLHLATCSMDSTVRISDLGQSPAPPRILGKTGEGMWSVSFSPDGRLLASSSGEKNVRIWDVVPAGPPPPRLTGHTSRIRCLAYSPDGQLLASASEDKTVRLWNPLKPLDPPRILGGTVEGVAGPDGIGHTGPVMTLAFTPDGQRLLSGSLDKTIRIWNLSASDAPVVVPGNPEWVRGLAVSPDGKRFAAVGGDKLARIWDLASPTQSPRELHGPADALMSCAFSPDSRYLAAGGAEAKVFLWDLGPGGDQPPQVLRGCQDNVYQVAFSPDGNQLAAGSGDQTIRIWDMANLLSDPLTLQGHSGDVLGLSFSPDGHLLCSASRDQTVRLWNLALPGSEAEKLFAHGTGVFTVASSPDGRQLAAAGGSDFTISILPVNALDMMGPLSSLPRRNLTKDEWQKYIGPDIPYSETIPGLPIGRTAADPPNR